MKLPSAFDPTKQVLDQLPDPPTISLGRKKKFNVLQSDNVLRELEELVKKIDVIEKDCAEERVKEEAETTKDEFVSLKRHMYKTLAEVKDLIRTRHHIQNERGNTVEAIQKGALINKKLGELDVDFQKVKEVYMKQTKRAGKKYTAEQLDQRFRELQLLKQQIEESKHLYHNAVQYSEKEIRTLTDFRSQMQEKNIPPQEWRDPTAEEQEVIDRWRQRDDNIDHQVGEIGEIVDRAENIAIRIGEEATKQEQVVTGLLKQADEANEELQAVNTRIKKIMLKQKGMNFFCKLLLSVILIGLIGYIISNVSKRITGNK